MSEWENAAKVADQELGEEYDSSRKRKKQLLVHPGPGSFRLDERKKKGSTTRDDVCGEFWGDVCVDGDGGESFGSSSAATSEYRSRAGTLVSSEGGGDETPHSLALLPGDVLNAVADQLGWRSCLAFASSCRATREASMAGGEAASACELKGWDGGGGGVTLGVLLRSHYGATPVGKVGRSRSNSHQQFPYSHPPDHKARAKKTAFARTELRVSVVTGDLGRARAALELGAEPCEDIPVGTPLYPIPTHLATLLIPSIPSSSQPSYPIPPRCTHALRPSPQERRGRGVVWESLCPASLFVLHPVPFRRARREEHHRAPG